MTKHEEYLQLMLKQNKELFDQFGEVHERYLKAPKKTQKEFNQIGRDVQDVIMRYENMLCGSTEKGGYGKFSGKLAEKFHSEIKTIYPKIDSIGLE